MIGGLVLAGGRSHRFGREKALAVIAGEPMISRVVRVLRHGVDQVAVSAREGSLACAYALEHGLEQLSDAPDDEEGPLAGIRAGLRWAMARRFEGLATAPCDAPFLPDDLVPRLVAVGRGAPAAARTLRGLEPLCAFWPVSVLWGLERLDGHPPVHAVLAQAGAVEVAFEDAEGFANLNTPEEFRSAGSRLNLSRAGRSDPRGVR